MAEVPPPMEPMAPIPVSNNDKMGLHSGTGNGSNDSNDPTTPTTSPSSLLNKPNDSCDSVDASSADNAFSSDTVQGSSSGVITADTVEKAIQERSRPFRSPQDPAR